MATVKPCSICGEMSTTKCGKCLVTFYCSRDCQIKDWPNHKAKCKPQSAVSATTTANPNQFKFTIRFKDNTPRLEAELRKSVAAMGHFKTFVDYVDSFKENIRVASIPGKGRGLIAARDMPVGTPVFVEPPFITAWEGPKAMYPAIRNSAGINVDSATGGIGVLVELVLQFLNQGSATYADRIPIDLSIDEFLAIFTSTEDSNGPTRKAILSAVAQFLISPGGKKYPLAIQNFAKYANKLDTIVSILQQNNLGGQKGVALYLLGGLVNHDCDPNCLFVINEAGRFALHNYRPVKAGEELTFSYVQVFNPVAEKQKQLREGYGFTCTCLACTKLPDQFRRFVCPKCTGPVLPTADGTGDKPWICIDCSYEATAQDKAVFLKDEEAVVRSASVSEADQYLKSHKGGTVGPGHWKMYQNMIQLREMYTQTMGDNADTYTIDTYLCEYAERLLPSEHPWLGPKYVACFDSMVRDPNRPKKIGKTPQEFAQHAYNLLVRAERICGNARGRDDTYLDEIQQRFAAFKNLPKIKA